MGKKLLGVNTEMEPEIRDDRQMRALTGVPPEKLELLEAAFAKAFAEEKEKIYQNQIKDGKRQRKPGGGQKGKLPTIREKLILCFTTSNLHFLYPILGQALVSLGVFPHRKFETVEEFRAACQNIETLLIDATERPYRRPVDNDKQADLYSGKKRITLLRTP